MPPAFTPGRLKKAAELLREPSFMDVKTDVEVGGFSSSLPVVVGSVGSTHIASKTALAVARGAARTEGYKISLLIGGRLYDGGHVVKSLALGASSTYMARPFLIAALARGEKGVENYIESLKVKIQMLTSALGKYDVGEISSEDVASLDKDVAAMLGIPYVYS